MPKARNGRLDYYKQVFDAVTKVNEVQMIKFMRSMGIEVTD